MRKFFILILIFSIISCSQQEIKKDAKEKEIVSEKKIISKKKNAEEQMLNKTKKNTQNIKLDKYKEKEIKKAMKESIQKVILAVKKGRLFTKRYEKKFCLILKSDEKPTIEIFELLSSPDNKNRKLGQNFYSETLSNLVEFKDKERFFWYDDEGNIDFAEHDFQLRVFDRPPKADIIIFSKNKRNRRVGFIDVIKQRALVNHLELVFY